jgi:predicted MFS family arabinose efflux permease
MTSWLENLYRALWSKVGGKPWTEIIREDQKRSPLVFLLVFAVLGILVGKLAGKYWWQILLGFLLGILCGHFWW